ncbi:serine phosphatase RsbU (regulator of sigma subunit) [Kibdelosporangium banguiense]|uniref:Serine phosphatase RsbU (Regulator of sigma subunit) n=1 Tax=Kibdelosporangium banguiense TaxID=1365924 RepID=A0ABS4TLX3_9PSEU|nr:PP2C family protein-serine/threonine phosphatase [Kibdelosporangium banguiense]MBP2325405.1 serine phosphatase RsbU (regulator of sigma subunit) [Kibdelosporangium banguiense]
MTDAAASARPAVAQQEEAAFLADVGGRLCGSLDIAGTASAVAELASPVLAERAIVLLPASRGRWEWWCHVLDGRTLHGKVRRLAPSVAPVLARAMVASQTTLRVIPRAEVSVFPGPLRDALGDFSEISVVPLVTDQGVTPGVLILARSEPVTEPEQQMTRQFASRAGAALGAASLYGKQLAAIEGLETTLHPAELPTVPGARMAALYRPAAGPLRVGGDFYDVHPRSDGTMLFVLGDVCGNGPEAAALTGSIRHALGALHLVEREPHKLMDLVNQMLLATGRSRFASLVVGSMTTRGADTMRVALGSGGHPCPLVLRGDGRVEEIIIPGMLVGVTASAKFGQESVELDRGDVCLLYTDGITEARGGPTGDEMFGEARLNDLLAACLGKPIDTILADINAGVAEWLGGNDHDDIALLAVQPY